MSHLDAAGLRQLLEGADADPALLAHLEAGCETCDAALAAVSALDGEIDLALLRLAPRPLDAAAPPWRRAREVVVPLRRRVPVAAWGALAAAALLLLLVPLLRAPAGGEPGVKGARRPPTLRLEIAARTPDGAFASVPPGATVSARDVLVLRTDASHAAEGWVLLQRGASRTPEVLEALAVPAGPAVLERQHGLLGLSLDGEAGAVTVWVVVGATPPSREAAVAAVESADPSPLVRAGFHLHVTP